MNSDSQTRWSGRISSHWDTCWKDSNEHWECAVAMVERLRTDVKSKQIVLDAALRECNRLQAQVEQLEKAEAVQHGPRITVYGTMQPEGSEEAPQGYA